ncbi:hypothetical protein D3C75_776850 [compost metagenome]
MNRSISTNLCYTLYLVNAISKDFTIRSAYSFMIALPYILEEICRGGSCSRSGLPGSIKEVLLPCRLLSPWLREGRLSNRLCRFRGFHNPVQPAAGISVIFRVAEKNFRYSSSCVVLAVGNGRGFPLWAAWPHLRPHSCPIAEDSFRYSPCLPYSRGLNGNSLPLCRTAATPGPLKATVVPACSCPEGA